VGVRDEDTVSTLAGRLARLDRELDDKDRERISAAAGGKRLTDIVNGLLDAIDPDRIEAEATAAAQGQEPTEEQRNIARDKLVGQAANIFTGPLIDLIDGIRREKEQTIDHENLYKVIVAEWDGDAKENAESLTKDFAAYLEEHRDQIEALTIFFGQPARRSEITYAMIRSVFDALKTDRPKLAPIRVWRAYALLDEYKGTNPANELTALVALMRDLISALNHQRKLRANGFLHPLSTQLGACCRTDAYTARNGHQSSQHLPRLQRCCGCHETGGFHLAH
jgi:type I restriction enzyme R subunit